MNEQKSGTTKTKGAGMEDMTSRGVLMGRINLISLHVSYSNGWMERGKKGRARLEACEQDMSSKRKQGNLIPYCLTYR